MENSEGQRPEGLAHEPKHSRRQRKVFDATFSVGPGENGAIDYANPTLEDVQRISYADRVKIDFNLPLNFQRTLHSVIDLFSPDRRNYSNAKRFKKYLKASPYFSGIEENQDLVRKVALREISFPELQKIRQEK